MLPPRSALHDMEHACPPARSLASPPAQAHLIAHMLEEERTLLPRLAAVSTAEQHVCVWRVLGTCRSAAAHGCDQLCLPLNRCAVQAHSPDALVLLGKNFEAAKQVGGRVRKGGWVRAVGSWLPHQRYAGMGTAGWGGVQLSQLGPSCESTAPPPSLPQTPAGHVFPAAQRHHRTCRLGACGRAGTHRWCGGQGAHPCSRGYSRRGAHGDVKAEAGMRVWLL